MNPFEKDILKYIAGGLRRNVGALALSGASQVVSSLTNFCVVLYLVRKLEKEDFGRYSIGFAAYLVIASIITAMFAVQYVVNNSDRADFEQRPYAMHYVVAVAMIGTVIIIMAVTLGAGLSSIRYFYFSLLGLSFPVAFAAAAFSTRDILVRIAFVERREWLAFGSAITVGGSAAVLFLSAFFFSIELNAKIGILIVAVSQSAGAVFILLLIRLPWPKLSLAGLLETFADSWQGGRWNALTSIVYSVRNQAHNLIVIPILGLTALAEVNAARILLTPAIMVIPPLYQVVMPRLSEMRSQGKANVRHITWLTIGGLVGFASIYCSALVLSVESIIPRILGSAYSNLSPVVIAWCAVTIFLAARNGLTMGLEVLKNFRALLIANTIAALVAVLMVVGLSFIWGGLGTVWAIALAEIVLCLLLYRALGKAVIYIEFLGSEKADLKETDIDSRTLVNPNSLYSVASGSPK